MCVCVERCVSGGDSGGVERLESFLLSLKQLLSTEPVLEFGPESPPSPLRDGNKRHDQHTDLSALRIYCGLKERVVKVA